jgi:hypothetical protein
MAMARKKGRLSVSSNQLVYKTSMAGSAAQVRTKKRVSDHGEVLTGHREVNACLI